MAIYSFITLLISSITNAWKVGEERDVRDFSRDPSSYLVFAR